MPRRKITTAERNHQDYLRRKGLKTGLAYERRLKALRAHEVKRVLELCRDHFDPDTWEAVIQGNLSEDYLPEWEVKLYNAVGAPMAKSTARDLSIEKAAADTGMWESALTRYARQRAGQNIVIVTGTLRDTLIGILRKRMEEDTTAGIEKLAKRVYADYGQLAPWMVRRIAQTESMIGMADAANVAAQTLDVKYTKVWSVSGLGNTRDTHMAMDGWECEQDEAFVLPDGSQMQYPHDTGLGAPAEEIINCACCCIRRPK